MKRHYKGELGEFTYDTSEFQLKKSRLVYVGDRKKTPIIPQGITDCSHMFSETYIEKTPVIPQSVKKCVSMFSHTYITEPPVIPEGVEDCTYMFAYTSFLKTPPVIPDSVKHCTHMFNNSAITEAPLIPSGIENCDSMYRECQALKSSPDIPYGIKSGCNMFWKCLELEQMPKLPEGIQDCTMMFCGCKKITEASLPDSIVVANEMFEGCDNLRTVKNFPKKLKSARYMFSWCEKLTSIPEFPESLIHAESMFYGCISLKTVPKLPDIIYDCQYMFHSCWSLSEIPDLPDSIYNASFMFYECKELKKAPKISAKQKDCYHMFDGSGIVEPPIIPHGVSNLSYMFCNCKDLTLAPEIPDGVTDCCEMFFRCESLKIAPNIPDTVHMCREMFAHCTGLTYVSEVPGAYDTEGMFFECTSLKHPPKLKSGIKHADRMFYECSELIEMPQLPEGILYANYMFTRCYSLKKTTKLPESICQTHDIFRDCLFMKSHEESGNRPLWDNIVDKEECLDKYIRYILCLNKDMEDLIKEYPGLTKAEKRILYKDPAISVLCLEMMKMIGSNGTDDFLKLYESCYTSTGNICKYKVRSYYRLFFSSEDLIYVLIKDIAGYKGSMYAVNALSAKNTKESPRTVEEIKDCCKMYTKIKLKNSKLLVCRNGKDILSLSIHKMHDELTFIYNRLDEDYCSYDFYDEPEYQKNVYELNGCLIRYPRDSKELLKIGQSMNNCVYSYKDSVKDKRCTIMCMEEDGEYVGCFELNGMNTELHQIKGKKNSYLKGKYANIVKKWIEAKNLGHDIYDYNAMIC